MARDRPDTAGSAHVQLTDPFVIEELRPQMVKFATLQIGDSDAAEDAVQEALIGALKNSASFGGLSALKTWVFAILKNKIIDTLRQRQRFVETARVLGDGPADDLQSTLFDSRGHWHPHERPVSWGDPEAALREDSFWKVFETCLDRLPAGQARAFMMREFVELDSGEICANLGITLTNLNVILHRARLRLRECLENHWILEGRAPC